MGEAHRLIVHTDLQAVFMGPPYKVPMPPPLHPPYTEHLA